jgi:hypothetical protein
VAVSKKIIEQPTIKEMLVKLWSVAAAQPGYDSIAWRQFQGALVKAGIKPLVITDDDIKSGAAVELPIIRKKIRGLCYTHAEINLPEVQALRAMPYRQYLTTAHWKAVRERAIREANGECRMCGHSRKLIGHHQNYDFVGCEESKDVIAICNGCHEKHHGKSKRKRRLFNRKSRGDYYGLTRQSDI